jgi:hypothetical protein
MQPTHSIDDVDIGQRARHKSEVICSKWAVKQVDTQKFRTNHMILIHSGGTGDLAQMSRNRNSKSTGDLINQTTEMNVTCGDGSVWLGAL